MFVLIENGEVSTGDNDGAVVVYRNGTHVQMARDAMAKYRPASDWGWRPVTDAEVEAYPHKRILHWPGGL
jgi:hypothetical protein